MARNTGGNGHTPSFPLAEVPGDPARAGLDQAEVHRLQQGVLSGSMTLSAFVQRAGG